MCFMAPTLSAPSPFLEKLIVSNFFYFEKVELSKLNRHTVMITWRLRRKDKGLISCNQSNKIDLIAESKTNNLFIWANFHVQDFDHVIFNNITSRKLQSLYFRAWRSSSSSWRPNSFQKTCQKTRVGWSLWTKDWTKKEKESKKEREKFAIVRWR